MHIISASPRYKQVARLQDCPDSGRGDRVAEAPACFVWGCTKTSINRREALFGRIKPMALTDRHGILMMPAPKIRQKAKSRSNGYGRFGSHGLTESSPHTPCEGGTTRSVAPTIPARPAFFTISGAPKGQEGAARQRQDGCPAFLAPAFGSPIPSRAYLLSLRTRTP